MKIINCGHIVLIVDKYPNLFTIDSIFVEKVWMIIYRYDLLAYFTYGYVENLVGKLRISCEYCRNLYLVV